MSKVVEQHARVSIIFLKIFFSPEVGNKNKIPKKRK